MCFNVRIGFENVPNRVRETETNVNALKSFSLLLCDTIIVAEASADAAFKPTNNQVLTNFSSEWSNVSFDMDEGEEDEDEATAKLLQESGKRVTRGMIRAEQRKLDGEEEEEETALMLRNKHQLKLFKELQQQRLHQETGSNVTEAKKAEVADIACFPSPAQYPAELKRDQIFVDVDHEVLFVPIHGTPVPFSIHTIKTVSMTEDGGYGYFRVNFHTPQNSGNRKVLP